MTLAFTIGPWDGFYIHNGYTLRLCLGWLALTILPVDFDCLLEIFTMTDPAIIAALFNVADCAKAIAENNYQDATGDPQRITVGEQDYIALCNALTVLEALEAAAKDEVPHV